MAEQYSDRPAAGNGLTYRQAGVDIDAGEALVERIRPSAAATKRPGVLGSIGGFGGLFELPVQQYRRPVLVSGTDGVGTKLRLAIDHDRHEGIGIDLVAMCVNDIVVSGAEPLFMLDYYATGRLDVDRAATVVESIAAGCRLAGAALIGGETAEMPGMYGDGDYDLAGFCVGVVEYDAIIDGRTVEPGDVLLAMASSGPHSNGYSLIRKVLADRGIDPTGVRLEDGQGLIDALLEPTRIYVRAVQSLIKAGEVRGLAHITGGGLTGNLPRILPEGVRARIALDSWTPPPVFAWLQHNGGMDSAELLRTFNCGVGMVAVVRADQVEQALAALTGAGERAWVLGHIVAGERGVTYASGA